LRCPIALQSSLRNPARPPSHERGHLIRESFRNASPQARPTGYDNRIRSGERRNGRRGYPHIGGAAQMKDFWISSGHHLLTGTRPTALSSQTPFSRPIMARPELLPPQEACETERRLHHELLMHHPRRPVTHDEIAAIEDPDARENWRIMIAFRDRLLTTPSLEAAYLQLALGSTNDTPPLLMNQLTQVVLRNALDGETEPSVLRAAELVFPYPAREFSRWSTAARGRRNHRGSRAKSPQITTLEHARRPGRHRA
jgi:hypothetical protein